MTTLNGHALLALQLVIPRLGAWTADVEIDSDADLTGAVTLDLEGRVWRGTVVRGAVAYGRWSGRIVGGAGGLGRELPPLALATTTLQVVLAETLRAAGETAAPSTADLSVAVTRWHRLRAPGDLAIADIARAAGLPWRVLADGTVWVGAETWAPVTLRDVDVMGREPITGCTELAGDAALDLQPGRTVTLDGTVVRIGAVTHRLEGVALRTSVLEEREDVAGGRLMAAFEAVVRRITRRLDFTGSYSARVEQQRADGSLDLRPEDPRRPSCASVPYRTLPGLTVQLPVGARVCFTYEDADPRRPVVTLWEPTTAAGRWTLYGGTHGAARSGHAVRVTIPPATVEVANPLFPGTPGAPPTIPNGAPILLDGTITEGTDLLRLP